MLHGTDHCQSNLPQSQETGTGKALFQINKPYSVRRVKNTQKIIIFPFQALEAAR